MQRGVSPTGLGETESFHILQKKHVSLINYHSRSIRHIYLLSVITHQESGQKWRLLLALCGGSPRGGRSLGVMLSLLMRQTSGTHLSHS